MQSEYLFIKKDFDAINHDILIRKVEMYGIRGIVLDWIESYLQREQQFYFVVCSTCWGTLFVLSPRGQCWDSNHYIIHKRYLLIVRAIKAAAVC